MKPELLLHFVHTQLFEESAREIPFDEEELRLAYDKRTSEGISSAGKKILREICRELDAESR